MAGAFDIAVELRKIRQSLEQIAANQLSPRLQLAGMAMAGIVANAALSGSPQDYAKDVVLFTDALLAAEKEENRG